MSSDVEAVIRPFLLGMATGGRTTAGLVGLALTTPVSPQSPQPLRALSSPWSRRLLPLLATGELVADKLPGTPSRLAWPGLSGRAAAGTVSGLALAERDGGDGVATAVLSLAGSMVGSMAGAALRHQARRRGWRDAPVALGEDLVVAALVFMGASAARAL